MKKILFIFTAFALFGISKVSAAHWTFYGTAGGGGNTLTCGLPDNGQICAECDDNNPYGPDQKWHPKAATATPPYITLGVPMHIITYTANGTIDMEFDGTISSYSVDDSGTLNITFGN